MPYYNTNAADEIERNAIRGGAVPRRPIGYQAPPPVTTSPESGRGLSNVGSRYFGVHPERPELPTDPRVQVAELELQQKRTPSYQSVIPSPLDWANYNLNVQQAQEQQRVHDMMYGPKEETMTQEGGTSTFGTESATTTTIGTLAPTEETVKAVTDEFRSGIESVLTKVSDPTQGWSKIQGVLTTALDTIKGAPEYQMVKTAVERELNPATIEAERTKLMAAAKMSLAASQAQEMAAFKNAAIPAEDRKALATATRDKYANLKMQIPFQVNESLKDRVASALQTGVQFALGAAGTQAELYGRGLSLLESVGGRQAQIEAAMRTSLMEAGLTPTRGEVTTTSEATRGSVSPTWQTGTSTTSPLNYQPGEPITSMVPQMGGGGTFQMPAIPGVGGPTVTGGRIRESPRSPRVGIFV